MTDKRDTLVKRLEEKNDQWQMCCRDRAALAERVEELEKLHADDVFHSAGLVSRLEAADDEITRLREAVKELGGICGIHSSGWMIAQEALEASDE